jgi:hypothetical protein
MGAAWSSGSELSLSTLASSSSSPVLSLSPAAIPARMRHVAYACALHAAVAASMLARESKLMRRHRSVLTRASAAACLQLLPGTARLQVMQSLDQVVRELTSEAVHAGTLQSTSSAIVQRTGAGEGGSRIRAIPMAN